jgi:hypothetical protein
MGGMRLKKGTVEAIITGVLMLVLVFVVLPKLAGNKKTAKIGAPKTTAPDPELPARVEKLKARATQGDPRIRDKQMERASLPWGRDPFFVSGLENVKPPLICTWVLSGDSEHDASALINGEVVGEGGTIEGYLIEQITEDMVVLERGGAELRFEDWKGVRLTRERSSSHG